MATLVEVIELKLIPGRRVPLSDLGSFYLTLSSEGAENLADFSQGSIKRAAIRFRPGRLLKRLVKILNYNKVSNGVSGEESANEIAA